MKLNKLVSKAKEQVDKRGGMDALKADARELKEVAKGEGSLKDKAKAAAKAIKEPGNPDAPATPPEDEGPIGRGGTARQSEQA